MNAARQKQRAKTPDDIRMTLGEHLEELRTRLIRAIAGLAVGAILCYVFVDYVMAFLTWPVSLVLEREGFAADMNYMGVGEPFFTDIKIAIIVGLILSAPYSLAQIWGFIAAGLYPNERRWVKRFAPVSVALFFIGATFLLVIVAPLLVRFLITYKKSLPDLTKTFPMLAKLVPAQETIPIESPFAEVAEEDWLRIPAFETDPANAPEGAVWVNLNDHELRATYGDSVYKLTTVQKVTNRRRLKPMIRLSEYITFTLHLAAAFGIGFQVPVVVAFIAVIGVATAEEMGKLRRYVWFGMAIGAAMITPPDIGSMVCLLGPMMLLYEAGLVAARFIQREANQKTE